VVFDSRRHMGVVPGWCLTPNAGVFGGLAGRAAGDRPSLEALAGDARAAAARAGRPVFVTLGERGMLAADAGRSWHLPAFPPRGPIDPVGAGDSVLAALAAALAAGANVPDAALLATLVASLTVEQLGTTGTADPAGVRRRFAEYAREFPGLAGP